MMLSLLRTPRGFSSEVWSLLHTMGKILIETKTFPDGGGSPWHNSKSML
jgi:hypothetical protein